MLAWLWRLATASSMSATDELGLPVGNAVDFWTEASLFSAGGYTALVYGPGDIAQAHTADEFVTLAQLRGYADSVDAIINGSQGKCRGAGPRGWRSRRERGRGAAVVGAPRRRRRACRAHGHRLAQHL